MGNQITLLRHGEAEQGFGINGDIKRKLTARGVFKLERLARVLKEREVSFDLLLKSPAQRTLQTAEIIGESIKIGLEDVKDDFYMADSEALFTVINQLSDQYHRVILVGHNPGISTLLAYLTNDFHLSLLPGMMAVVDLEADSWQAVSRGSGTLVEVLQ